MSRAGAGPMRHMAAPGHSPFAPASNGQSGRGRSTQSTEEVGVVARIVQRTLVILAILAAVFASSAVLSPNSKPASAQHLARTHVARSIHSLKMEVIVKTTNSPYWQIVFSAAKKAAKQFGVQSLGYVGGPSEADINAEITLVENAIAKHPDFLVIASTSATALNNVIAKAEAARIKVIVIDSAVTTKRYTAFLATDNVLGGCLAARALAAAIACPTRRTTSYPSAAKSSGFFPNFAS